MTQHVCGVTLRVHLLTLPLAHFPNMMGPVGCTPAASRLGPLVTKTGYSVRRSAPIDRPKIFLSSWRDAAPAATVTTDSSKQPGRGPLTVAVSCAVRPVRDSALTMSVAPADSCVLCRLHPRRKPRNRSPSPRRGRAGAVERRRCLRSSRGTRRELTGPHRFPLANNQRKACRNANRRTRYKVMQQK